MLWIRLKKDDFETNVVDVLKEMSDATRERLNNLKASDFLESSHILWLISSLMELHLLL